MTVGTARHAAAPAPSFPAGGDVQWRSVGLFLVLTIAGAWLLLQPWMQAHAMRALSVLITALAGDLLEVLGFTVVRRGHVLATSDLAFRMTVENDCNGAWAHLILLAGVLAHPASWRAKALGVIALQPILFALNVVRVSSLFVVGVLAPGLFRATHVYVWQVFIIALAVVLFTAWADRLHPSVEERGGS